MTLEFCNVFDLSQNLSASELKTVEKCTPQNQGAVVPMLTLSDLWLLFYCLQKRHVSLAAAWWAAAWWWGCSGSWPGRLGDTSDVLGSVKFVPPRFLAKRHLTAFQISIFQTWTPFSWKPKGSNQLGTWVWTGIFIQFSGFLATLKL